MGNYEQTSMGGVRETFLTTHWSIIEDVKQHPDRDRALIGLLLQRYWKPVYCYVRRKGYDNEQAKDLTQGFLHEVVLNRHLIERADSTKGHFRAFLLHALNQYLIDEQRKGGAQKRIPREKLVPLEIADLAALPQVVHQLDAEQGFNYVWKAELLTRALAKVKEKYAGQGMKVHWDLFQSRLLDPTLADQEPPTLGQLCARYGIEDKATASNMIHTVKKQVRRVLKDLVRQTVLSEDGVKEELEDIVQFLDKPGKA